MERDLDVSIAHYLLSMRDGKRFCVDFTKLIPLFFFSSLSLFLWLVPRDAVLVGPAYV